MRSEPVDQLQTNHIHSAFELWLFKKMFCVVSPFFLLWRSIPLPFNNDFRAQVIHDYISKRAFFFFRLDHCDFPQCARSNTGVSVCKLNDFLVGNMAWCISCFSANFHCLNINDDFCFAISGTAAIGSFRIVCVCMFKVWFHSSWDMTNFKAL